MPLASLHPFPRAVYIHVPFCAHRCGYCNFTLVAHRDDLINDFLRAIELELSTLPTRCEVDTLFFGGGTPTHLAPAQLDRLCEIVRGRFPALPGQEFSVEANPADVNDERMSVLAAYGVTRISLGAQSFRADKLRQLERDHSPAQIVAAVGCCQRFNSRGIDLIFAAPGETLAQWQDDLRQAVALGVEHISTYGLTIEKGTSFWSRRERGALSPLGEESERELYSSAIDFLIDAGFEHYEVSNFARPGHRCRHNETYWLGGEYYAAGPGAARHINGRRELNHRSTTTYLRRVLGGQSPVAECEMLSPMDAARELLVFALRRLEGIDREWFAGKTGYELSNLVGPTLRRFVDQGLFTDDGQRVKLTRAGLYVSDAIWPSFLQSQPQETATSPTNSFSPN